MIGGLVGRIHADAVIAGRQAVTRLWWSTAASTYRLLISQLVVEQCSAGDDEAAERLDALESLELLDASPEVDALASLLTAAGAVPPSEPRDAYHIAIAAVKGVQFLVTCNCRHIANAAMRGPIEAVCRNAGFEPPVICTPDELSGVDDDS